jgi:hypothetical protein
MYPVPHICVALGPPEYPFFARVMSAVLLSTTVCGGWRNNDQAEKFKFTRLVIEGTGNSGCRSIARYFAAQIHVYCMYLCAFSIRVALGNNTTA